MGFDLTDAYDCHVFLIDGGDELAMIDTGAGMGAERILENVQARRLRSGAHPPDRADARSRRPRGRSRASCAGFSTARPCSPRRVCADWVRTGDEEKVSLDVAKKAAFYPADYVLEPCPVDSELADGDSIRIGDLSLTVARHARPLRTATSRCCSSATASGRCSRPTPSSTAATSSCRASGTAGSTRSSARCAACASSRSQRSSRRTSRFSLSDGQRHIERANDALDRLLIPNQLVSAW